MDMEAPAQQPEIQGKKPRFIPPPRPIGRTFSEYEIRLVRGMHKRGDTILDICTWTGINDYYVRRIRRGKRPEYLLKPLPPEELPPRPPYKVVSNDMYEKLRQTAGMPVAVLDEIHRKLEAIARDLETLKNAQPSRRTEGTVQALLPSGGVRTVPTQGELFPG